MKKYFLVATLVLASTNAMAERVISGTNGIASGGSRSEACESAKEDALGKRSQNEQVAKYAECECKQNEKGSWSCTVETTLEKTR